MNLWKSLKGQIVVELTSADVTGAMAALNQKGIPIHRTVLQDDLTVQIVIDRTEYSVVRKFAEKRGESVSIQGRTGLFWVLFGAAKRPVLLIGCVVLLLLLLTLPTRILFVRVEGNAAVPTREILAAAEGCGIRFGANRRQIRSEQVKNELLQTIPQLKWAGVNTSGCIATISVREGNTEATAGAEDSVSSLVARQEGVILSCTVTAGSGQCAPGQAVRQGQVLISGYTDCGLLIKATRAEGEVFAQTRRYVTVKSPVQRRICGPEEEVSRQYSLILGKKRINFANSSRICDASCGRMYKEYYITLPGGFALPVALAVQTHICRTTRKADVEPEYVEESLRSFARQYLTSQMLSGSIEEEEVYFSVEEGAVILEGDYLCQEMIAQRRQEGIGETNGENS